MLCDFRHFFTQSVCCAFLSLVDTVKMCAVLVGDRRREKFSPYRTVLPKVSTVSRLCSLRKEDSYTGSSTTGRLEHIYVLSLV